MQIGLCCESGPIHHPSDAGRQRPSGWYLGMILSELRARVVVKYRPIGKQVESRVRGVLKRKITLRELSEQAVIIAKLCQANEDST